MMVLAKILYEFLPVHQFSTANTLEDTHTPVHVHTCMMGFDICFSQACRDVWN